AGVRVYPSAVRERVKRRERARQRELEDRAVIVGAALKRRPVEVPVGSLYEAAVRIGAVAPAPQERMERCQRPHWRDLEDGTDTARAAFMRCPVEVPVGSLHEAGIRGHPVAAGKRVERRQHPRRSDLEDRAVTAHSAGNRRSVEVTVAGLDKASWALLRGLERMEDRVRL